MHRLSVVDVGNRACDSQSIQKQCKKKDSRFENTQVLLEDAQYFLNRGCPTLLKMYGLQGEDDTSAFSQECKRKRSGRETERETRVQA
jgi:hypothetical protein